MPLFLLLFAATYFLMAQANTDNFNVHSLTRTDSLYFTITVFATVGFGDISATSQVARMAVMVQMILDLLVLGLLVKVFLNAVEKGRGRRTTGRTPNREQRDAAICGRGAGRAPGRAKPRSPEYRAQDSSRPSPLTVGV